MENSAFLGNFTRKLQIFALDMRVFFLQFLRRFRLDFNMSRIPHAFCPCTVPLFSVQRRYFARQSELSIPDHSDSVATHPSRYQVHLPRSSCDLPALSSIVISRLSRIFISPSLPGLLNPPRPKTS